MSVATFHMKKAWTRVNVTVVETSSPIYSHRFLAPDVTPNAPTVEIAS
jgi:hypothetical protein